MEKRGYMLAVPLKLRVVMRKTEARHDVNEAQDM